jgi:NAD-dependent deacetylase
VTKQHIIMMKKKLVVLTGAGNVPKVASKLQDSDGLWEHTMSMMQPHQKGGLNPALVLDFYNQRRNNLRKYNPI